MKISFLFTFLCFFIFLNSSSAQDKISYEEITTRTMAKPCKKMLIIGFGSTVTRIFLDKLTGDLIARMEKQEIKAAYEYQGSEPSADFKVPDAAKFAAYDAVLVFSSQDSSHIQSGLKRKSYPTLTPQTGNINFSVARTQFAYFQAFNVALFYSSDATELIWDANFAVRCDLTKSKAYAKVSKQIFESLQKNKYF